MTLHGSCLDTNNPNGHPDPVSLAMIGLNGGRVQHKPNDRGYLSYLARFLQCQMELVICCDHDSFAHQDYQAEGRAIARELLSVGMTEPTIVLGNEQDAFLLPGPGHSWPMEPQTFGPFFAQTATGMLSVLPNARLVIGGLVSGQDWVLAQYIAAIRQTGYAGPIHGYDLHPYGASAEEMPAVWARYDQHIEPGMWGYCLEFQRPAEELPRYVQMLGETNWCYFCWSDAMVPGFGLLDAGGWPKSELRELSRVLP